MTGIDKAPMSENIITLNNVDFVSMMECGFNTVQIGQ